MRKIGDKFSVGLKIYHKEFYLLENLTLIKLIKLLFLKELRDIQLYIIVSKQSKNEPRIRNQS